MTLIYISLIILTIFDCIIFYTLHKIIKIYIQIQEQNLDYEDELIDLKDEIEKIK